MLSPDARQTLLDSLRPPVGYRLGCAVGTTFALHLDAALTAPAAFALYAVTDLREPREVEPLELLESIRRHASRFTVFFQAGQVAIPVQRRLFAYLEGAVVPVLAPNGGLFHPKVWVLRYDADGAPSSYRVLCASRNLTYDRSWDTMLRLDSLPADSDQASRFDPSELARFVSALPGLAVGQSLEERRRHDIGELGEQLAGVRWSAPAGVRAGRFLPMGLERSGGSPFPAAADNVAVISPFLSAGLLKRLPTATGRRVLVSRPDQILACSRVVRERFNEMYTLDPNASPSDDSVPPSGGTSATTTADDPSVPFEGLHAKLYVFDQGTGATVLTGSANATSAAFGSNVEFFTELAGSVKDLGVDALLAEPAKDVQTLRSFLVPFALDGSEGPADEPDLIGHELDALRHQIAALPLEATSLPADEADRFTLRFWSSTAIPRLPEHAAWRAWPITLPSEASREVQTNTLDLAFTVSFEGITAFLANEVQIGAKVTQFVLTAPLLEAPANRNTRLLRILLGDAQRFLRYLLLLLSDDTADRFGLGDLLDALDGDGAGKWPPAPESLPLLEALLRTLAREPERLEHVHRLITDLVADPEAGALLPQGLLDIWEPIWSAALDRRA